MKILLTGGGTGGHFYPIIAVAEALYDISEEEHILTPEIILMSDKQYDMSLIAKEGIIFKKVYAGKVRRYFSILNFTDLPKTFMGILKSIKTMYSDMPDVVFGKGGYASFPPLFAAKIFGIPVIIHESDSVPGKVNKWAGKFAHRIAVAFPEASKHFPKEKVALTGTPVRKSLMGHTPDEASEIFNLETNVPVVLFLGGSQGAQRINDTLLDILPELVENYQVIHQCGTANEIETKGRANLVLESSLFKSRYHLYPYMEDAILRNAASVANIVVSRAGGSAIYEIATWGLASILIPLGDSAQDHQRENAYNYARTQSAMVIEENNLTPHLLKAEIDRIIKDPALKRSMEASAKIFAKPDAARKIAKEIINIALEHAD